MQTRERAHFARSVFPFIKKKKKKTTSSYQQKTGSERKNPRKEFKKNSRSLDNHTVGTAKRKQPGQGKESSPPKEGRNPGRTAAYQPKSNKLQRKKPSEAQEKEEGATKSQGVRTAQQTPEEPNTQELQVGPQTCDQTTPTQEQMKDKQ